MPARFLPLKPYYKLKISELSQNTFGLREIDPRIKKLYSVYTRILDHSLDSLAAKKPHRSTHWCLVCNIKKRKERKRTLWLTLTDLRILASKLSSGRVRISKDVQLESHSNERGRRERRKSLNPSSPLFECPLAYSVQGTRTAYSFKNQFNLCHQKLCRSIRLACFGFGLSRNKTFGPRKH